MLFKCCKTKNKSPKTNTHLIPGRKWLFFFLFLKPFKYGRGSLKKLSRVVRHDKPLQHHWTSLKSTPPHQDWAYGILHFVHTACIRTGQTAHQIIVRHSWWERREDSPLLLICSPSASQEDRGHRKTEVWGHLFCLPYCMSKDHEHFL